MNTLKKKVYFKEVPAFISKIVDHLRIQINLLQLKDMYSLSYQTIYAYEEKVKDYFDAYMFLLTNASNVVSERIITKSIFLLTGKRVNKKKISIILSEFISIKEEMSIKKIIDFSIQISSLIRNKKDAYIYNLELLNYLLIFNNSNAIKYINKDLYKLDICLKEYKKGNKGPLYEFIILKEKTSKELPDNYYENLKEISLEEIASFIKENKEIFIKKYKIESLAIFGSFAKGKARLDSDIDLIIRFQEFVSLIKKRSYMNEIKELIFTKFNRLCDLHIEESKLDDREIKIFKDNIKII